VCLQVKLCDPHLSALEVRFSRRGAIQIYVYLYLCAQDLSTVIDAVGYIWTKEEHIPDYPDSGSESRTQDEFFLLFQNCKIFKHFPALGRFYLYKW